MTIVHRAKALEVITWLRDEVYPGLVGHPLDDEGIATWVVERYTALAPRHSFDWVRQPSLEAARGYIATAPALRLLKVTFEAYVPTVDVADRPKLEIPEPFALTPPAPEVPRVCGSCGEPIRFVGGSWVDETDGDGCAGETGFGDGVHSPIPPISDEHIEEWLNFELHAHGSISGQNPLTRFSLEAFNVGFDVEDVP